MVFSQSGYNLAIEPYVYTIAICTMKIHFAQLGMCIEEISGFSLASTDKYLCAGTIHMNPEIKINK